MMSERVVVANEEMYTVREAMRGLNTLIDKLQSGELEQVVLTKRSKIVAIVRAAR